MSDYSSPSDSGHSRGASPLNLGLLVGLLMLTMLGGGFAAWKIYKQKTAGQAAIEAEKQAKLPTYRVDPETGTLSKVGSPTVQKKPGDPDIGEFELTERSGKTITNKDLLGKPWAVCFVFSRCAGQCLNLTANMARLQRELDGAPVRLVTITVDPKYDTPEVLQNYADNFGADPEGWLFLTGDHEYVYRLLRGYFRQMVQELTGEERRKGYEVIHTSDVLHIDARGNIVKKYNGLNDGGMTRLRRALLEEAEELAKKNAPNTKDKIDPKQSAVAEKPAGRGKDD